MQIARPPHIDLTELAKKCMAEKHLLVDYPPQLLQELAAITKPAIPDSPSVRDMRDLLWFSLDNDDSRDLDQLTYAVALNEQESRIYIAIADVDSLVKKESAIDRFAQENTTSVYTPTKIFAMLPEKLSTNLTSLNEQQNRLAIVVEVNINNDGSLNTYHIYQAYVCNKAKLAYNSVSAWLDGVQSAPRLIQASVELDKQVRLQDKIAQSLRAYRHKEGALTLQTLESHAIVDDNQVMGIEKTSRNRGKDLIEDFMIAANKSIADFLFIHKIPSLRRVVRIPRRWDRIVALASEYHETLPPEPDAVALDLFLKHRLSIDPLHFPDLSLIIIKLLGNGEYVVQYPGQQSIGHFSLAVKNYTHSTAPNRRYPDVITQRVIKSVLNNQPTPYTESELEKLAKHCTQKEDDVDKVERKMRKVAACVFLLSHINEEFDALVTGSSIKGTWVRTLQIPVEGKLIAGFKNTDVGDQLRVKLVHVDVGAGFIDFVRI